MSKFRFALCCVIVAGLAACQQPLLVDNKNNADIDRALATPADLENFLGATYLTAHQGTLGGSNDALQTQLIVMGFESVSGLANFAMGPRGAVPRGKIDNSPNGSGDAGNLRDFTVEHRAARMATVGLYRLTKITLGSPARDARAQAFAHFALGVALGNLALSYDSASILTQNDNFSAIIPFSGYQVVLTSALAHIDTAIAIASQPTPMGPTADWFPLPSTWIAGQPLTVAQFVQFGRSYKARFRAGVARNAAERAAVDWTQVIADANAGIAADFNIAMNPSTGWDVSWVIQAYATGSASWHQMSQFLLGMADTSGAYDAWLALPNASRAPFAVVTGDNRYPTGTTRAAQQAVVVAGTFASKPYWRNRPTGEDAPAPTIGASQYDFYRSRAFSLAARIGNYPIMTAAEMRLLAAEGYFRTGKVDSMIIRINVSRTAAGLPAIPTTVADTLTPVPGSAAGCTPHVPDAAQGFTKSHCGNVWDALKYEYRMETAFTGYGMWYFASRGWGDLPEGTAINWPVPNEELLLRRESVYGLGGVNLPGGAAKGNYGLFSGGVY